MTSQDHSNSFKYLIEFLFYFFRVEKNATPWSQDKIKELLLGVVVENEQGNYSYTYKHLPGSVSWV